MKFIVREFSGLGNQLFQYAAGRYYAQKHGAQMVLAIDAPQDAVSYGSPRPFLLSRFAIDAPYRELTTMDRILLRLPTHHRLQPVALAISAALRVTMRLEIATEEVAQRFRFQPDVSIWGKTATVYLVGYWQVHQIAEAISETLRSEFALREAATGKNREVLRLIQSTPNAVSLHIRRGDYLLGLDGHFALTMPYYTESIKRIEECVTGATFFVFSDDIDFARNALAQDLPAVFVDHNDAANPHEDLRLMSSCRHHIIANSTFSWWGAWLNPDPEKVVFAPRKWLAAQGESYDDLFPPSWRLLG